MMDQNRFLTLVTKEFLADITTEEQAELHHYLRHHEEKRKEYHLLRQYWKKQESRAQNDERLFAQVMNKIKEAEKYNKAIRPSWWKNLGLKKYAIAASIALLLVLGIYNFQTYRRLFLSDEQALVTGLKKQSVLLADGTEVILNASSKLIYPKAFQANLREVSLEGEAFFNVSRKQRQPFIIHTPDMDIKVLGTSFNVRAYADERKTEASLISGAIEVSLPHQLNKKIRLKPKDKLILRKTETSSTDSNTQLASPSTAIRLAEISYYKPKDDTAIVETSWLQNKLAFKNENFGDIAKRLEKHFGVHIGFESQKVQDYQLNGVFTNEDVQQILYAFHLAAPFAYRIQGKEITIYD